MQAGFKTPTPSNTAAGGIGTAQIQALPATQLMQAGFKTPTLSKNAAGGIGTAQIQAPLQRDGLDGSEWRGYNPRLQGEVSGRGTTNAGGV